MKTLFKILLLATFTLIADKSFAETLASCSGENGQAYFPESSLVTSKDAGFKKDDVTEGLTSLIFNDKGEFDILFKDASGEIQSSKDDNGKVELLAFGDDNITILVRYFFETTEIFDFYKKPNQKLEYSHTVVKPYNTLLPKAAVYVGECNKLDLKPLNDWINANVKK